MASSSAVSDSVQDALQAALARDAGVPEPPRAVPPVSRPQAPPPKSQHNDPEAPHGRDDDGSPLTPYGTFKNGRPRLKPAPAKHTEPARVSPSVPAPPGRKDDPVSYSDDLRNLGVSVWMGASSLKGGKLFGLPIPDARPYAAIFYESMPDMVAAWDVAAQQNDGVRRWVKKFSGDGSWSWVIGVAVTTIGFTSGCAEMARSPQDVKARAADINTQNAQEFVQHQLKAMGLSSHQVMQEDAA